MERILWQSQKSPTRYFWIPAGESVYMGDYGIENADGEQFDVDLEGLLQFEITEYQAKNLLNQELDALLADFGSVVKNLAGVGRQLFKQAQNDEDSEDDSDILDSDEDDSEYSDSDSDDSDDSDSDDSDSDDMTWDEILSELENGLEGPLSELKDVISAELGKLGAELQKMGKEVAKEMDNPENREVLKELGEYFIQLSEQELTDEPSEENADEVISFDNAKAALENENDNDRDHDSVGEKEIASEQEDQTELSTDNSGASSDSSSQSEAIEIPDSSILNKWKKAELLELALSLGLELTDKNTKKDLLDGIESRR